MLTHWFKKTMQSPSHPVCAKKLCRQISVARLRYCIGSIDGPHYLIAYLLEAIGQTGGVR